MILNTNDTKSSKDLIKSLINDQGSILTVLKKQSVEKKNDLDFQTHRKSENNVGKAPLFIRKSYDQTIMKMSSSIAPPQLNQTNLLFFP